MTSKQVTENKGKDVQESDNVVYVYSPKQVITVDPRTGFRLVWPIANQEHYSLIASLFGRNPIAQPISPSDAKETK